MVAAAMPKGLTVSIKFTPQAKDDYLHFGEDSGGGGDYDTSDLLANDSAANAAKVWGIFGQSETYVQGHISSLVSNTAPNGDTTFTVGSATVTYVAATGDITVSFDPSAFQSLGVGESTEVGAFTYVIRMANGAFSTATAHIVVDGQNDAPVISVNTGAPTDIDSKELTETDAPLAASGTLTVNDVDTTDTVTMSVTDASGSVTGGYDIETNEGLDAAALAAFFSVNTGPVDANTGDVHNITWDFDSTPQAFDFLQAGEDLTITYTITAQDDSGAVNDSTTHDVTVVVHGTNDAASITDVTGGDFDVTEDSDLTAGGTLLVSDADHDQSAFDTAYDGTTAGANGHGTFTFDASTGEWTYTLDNTDPALDTLNAGDPPLTDTLLVKSVDGTEHTIMVTINGTDEDSGPTIAAPFTGTGDPNDFDGLGLPGDQNPSDFSGATRYGGPGDDHINGAPANTGINLYGGSGDDEINGNNAANNIYGGSGTDTITGNGDNDLIVGGYGADTLTGNGGNDTFQYLSILDTGDEITDFGAGDKLDFVAIDANSGSLGNQVFGLFADTAVHANSINYFNDGTNTTLWADTDGDTSTVELQIILQNFTGTLTGGTNILL